MGELELSLHAPRDRSRSASLSASGVVFHWPPYGWISLTEAIHSGFVGPTRTAHYAIDESASAASTDSRLTRRDAAASAPRASIPLDRRARRASLRRMKTSTIALASGVLAVAILNCGGGLCPELKGGAASASFTEDQKANLTLRAFVEASGDLAAVAAKVEAEVSEACIAMGHDLGLSDGDMKPMDGEGGKASGACTAVSAKIDAILKAGASASLSASVTPPTCNVSANAEAECHGRCEVEVDPGYVVAHCEPGKLSGTCEGTCGGACDGSCAGDCDGNCAVKDASGKCAGKCEGTCRGKCDATCHAQCTGEWKAPKCETEVKAPSADANCAASCKAHANLTAECTPAQVKITSSVNAGEMPKLVATLEAHLPALIKAEFVYGKRLAGDIETLVKIGTELPETVGKAGVHAAACVGASAEACVHAQASIHVSVEASASVSGKAGAHG